MFTCKPRSILFECIDAQTYAPIASCFLWTSANDGVLKKSKNCLNAEVQATRKYKERKNLAWAREGERKEAVVAAWRHAFGATDPPSSK